MKSSRLFRDLYQCCLVTAADCAFLPGILGHRASQKCDFKMAAAAQGGTFTLVETKGTLYVPFCASLPVRAH